MNVEVDIQLATATDCPSGRRLREWTRRALAGRREDAQLTVRVVDVAEMTTLNETYRGKPGPTNVLSFPCDTIPGVDLPLLGDVVICAPVVAREAAEQGKAAEAHWAHMVVHGVLHLLGYDHVTDQQAQAMEDQEVAILEGMGFGDPYIPGESYERRPK
jgi:probable rRNA maturation factor